MARMLTYKSRFVLVDRAGDINAMRPIYPVVGQPLRDITVPRSRTTSPSAGLDALASEALAVVPG
jgi:hypothetical protein